tara:strand:+ start:97 stop:402 length:306 start_codon:yes stop_codon:yes gene_type:complete
MRHLLIFLKLLVFFSSCEEEKETEMVCSEMEDLEARMPIVTNKFDREPSRANCDAIVNLTQEMYDCMSNGPKKDRMKKNLENMKVACNSNLIFFNQELINN